MIEHEMGYLLGWKYAEQSNLNQVIHSILLLDVDIIPSFWLLEIRHTKNCCKAFPLSGVEEYLILEQRGIEKLKCKANVLNCAGCVEEMTCFSSKV